MTKSAEHNSRLCAEAVAKSGVHSRFPKVSEQAECLPLRLESLPPFAYNPSILRNDGKLWMTYRYHFAGDFRTKLGIALISESGRLERIQELGLSGFSTDDARMFMYQREPWMCWVEVKWETGSTPKSVVKFAKMNLPHNDDPLNRRWELERIYQPDLSGNDWTQIQKNWCFFECAISREFLLTVYQTDKEQMIFNVCGDKAITQWNTKGSRWDYGAIRGGCIVPHGDNFLRFFHSSVANRGEHRYFIGALMMRSQPPFDVVAVSKKPVIYGSEVDSLKPADRKSCHHFKPNVVFPCGAVNYEKGWLLSIGVNDASCALVKLTESSLNL